MAVWLQARVSGCGLGCMLVLYVT